MGLYKLNEHGQISLQTSLSKGQITKFGGVDKGVVIIKGVAYLRVSCLHGVLMTTSKEQAREIVLANAPMLKEHFLGSQQTGSEPFISVAGACYLLCHLIAVNAKRAEDYRASLCLLACITSEHGAIKAADAARAKQQKAELDQAIKRLKQQHDRCQVSGKLFVKGMQRHAHHLAGRSENPQMEAELKNLILLDGKVHDEYHAWVKQKKLMVHPQTLGLFAVEKGYNGPYIQKMKRAGYGPFAPKTQKLISQVA